ncbi:hypothetical protein [Priestia flexa]|nr:hypothetical protein [Priestia flexa]MDT2046693.1 hypothetical protein [Priestia flexa]
MAFPPLAARPAQPTTGIKRVIAKRKRHFSNQPTRNISYFHEKTHCFD